MSLVFPETFPGLASERLALGPLTDADLEALYAIHSDPEAIRYWSTTPWTDAAPAAAMLARDREGFTRGEAIRWALRLRGDAALLGVATLFRFSAQNLRAETGYILRRSHWGRGYMSEAMDAILDYAFGPMGLLRVEADTDPRNTASVAMLERLGFAREGLLRRRWIVGGEVSDSLMLGLLKDERPARARKAHEA